MGRARVLALALVLSAGCVRRPAVFGARIPSGCTGRTWGTEQCFGWIRDRILMATTYRAYPDDELARYVSRVGARVVAATGDRGRWTFHVLDDPSPQAFAGLGRVIYVDRGALAVLRDEAELAGLLGHEIGHTIAGHQREAFIDALHATNLASTRTTRDERDDEVQADELAVRFLARAGYDPGGVERMLRALATLAPDSGSEEAHHPPWAVRIAHVQALAARLPATGTHDERALRRLLPSLVIGEDPRQLAIVDHAVVSARLGLAVDFPDLGDAAVVDGTVQVADVDVRVVPASVAAMIPATPELPIARRTVGGATLLISGRWRGAIRALRPAERARVVPRFVDLSRPRTLWPVD